MAERIRLLEWSTTGLGPLPQWCPALRQAVQFLLASPMPLVMLWGKDGYMIYNDAYAVFAGGRHPYLLGTAVELGWPEVAEFNRYVVDACLAGGTLSYSNKELVLLRDGQPETVWMDLHYSPVPGDDGAPAGVMAVVIETTAHMISEQRRMAAESDFRVANERLQLALNSGALLGTFVWDIENDRVSGDERFARTFMIPADRLQEGMAIEEVTKVVHPDDLDYLNQQIGFTVVNGGVFSAEYRIRRQDGHYLWILASGRCEFDAAGQPLRFPGVLIDIHERKIAEEALLSLSRTLEQRVIDEVQARAAMEEQLRQSQKLEAIGALTGGVAHDFNNLLQVVASNLYLLARHEADSPRVQARVTSALGAVDRGARLSAQLLAFARRQPLSPAVYNVRHIYEGLGDLLQRALGESISVDVQMPEDPWNLRVDRNQLENAILNLAINARDAMGGEGTLRITGANRYLDAEFCADKELVPGDYVLLSVADTGRGMSAEVLRRAFEPFFTTKAVGQGTGLGLSMVFGFVKQSGGYMTISSQPGLGTTVHLLFARCHDGGDQPPGSDIAVSEQVRGHETVLVVEDDPGVRHTAVELLRVLGYQVEAAANGDEAMARLHEGLAVDLIFSDVVMPGRIKSADLAAWARQRRPPIPVLFASGYTREIITRDNELQAGTWLLSKPYSPQELGSMLRAVLSQPQD
jgi:signal transduction histidine kinase/CheY-like chemotaxis protein